MSVDAARWRWIRALLIPLIIGAWLGLAILFMWLISHVTTAVLMLVLAAIIAYAIRPVVNLFSRWLPNSISIAAAYLVAFALVLVFLGFIVVTAAEQVARLVSNAPGYVKEAERLEPQLVALLHPLGINQIRIEDVRNALEMPSLAGAINFTVTNSLASFAMLIAIGLLYGRTGALDFEAIGRVVAGAAAHDAVIVGAFCLLSLALLTKAAIVPFQFWLSDAHAVAPSPVSVISRAQWCRSDCLGSPRYRIRSSDIRKTRCSCSEVC